MGETVPYIPNVLNPYNLWIGVALDFYIALQYPLCPLLLTMREKSPYLELFWSKFSGIWTEYEETLFTQYNKYLFNSSHCRLDIEKKAKILKKIQSHWHLI